MRKPILCRLGFHKPDPEWHIANYGGRKKRLTSRSAICKRCDKKLYLVDRYGNRKEGK